MSLASFSLPRKRPLRFCATRRHPGWAGLPHGHKKTPPERGILAGFPVYGKLDTEIASPPGALFFCLSAPIETGENFPAQAQGRILVRVNAGLHISEQGPQATFKREFMCVHRFIC